MNLTMRMRVQEWAVDYAEWKASGMTQKDWCRIKGLPLHTFEYRCRRVRKLADEMMGSKESLQPPAPAAFAAVPARLLEPGADPAAGKENGDRAPMTIRLKDATIEVTDQISARKLQTVLEVLTHAQ